MSLINCTVTEDPFIYSISIAVQKYRSLFINHLQNENFFVIFPNTKSNLDYSTNLISRDDPISIKTDNLQDLNKAISNFEILLRSIKLA